ncbi:hypothetical protein F511_11768 [Dorcoceras hygrometricum]|uniref:Trimethylguanosine synthase n=1 Tax=Dorcoceras hygrometricum TaxID=472368 RepID=A0A2Z7CE02_9LAMI|nr:hypothetical protein F511_11768 [Dorcoceras hygrometricum]
MGFLLDESPAIEALGPLFKLTEVHLWDGDDYSSAALEASAYLEPVKFNHVDYVTENSDAARINGFSLATEDVKLAEQLTGLGLPLSFQTNKERNRVISGRRKGTVKKNKLLPKVVDDELPQSVKECEENGSPSDAPDIPEMFDQSEIQNHDRDESVTSFACSCDITSARDSSDEASNLVFENNLGSFGLSNISLGESEASMSKNEEVASILGVKDGSFARSCSSNYSIFVNELKSEMESVNLEIPSIVDHETKGNSNDFRIEMMQDADVSACSKFATFPADITANHIKTDSEEWITYWDDFYLRNYFYNVITKETTWDPPVKLEHIPFVTADESTYKLVEMDEIGDDELESSKVDELHVNCYLQPELHFSKDLRDDDQQFDESAGSWILSDCITSIRNRKKKRVRRTKSDWKLSSSNEDLQGVLLEAAPSINKYWCQRYILFSRFDDGIKMDEEGWFSVTPEPLAKHHARRCGSGSIIDFFTGVGGNAIQFAQRSKHVIAIDIDPNKIDYAVHNASIYGVEDKIDFVRGDSFSLAPKLKADTVFMSPPWGGPDYTRVKKFDINTMLKPKNGKSLFNVGKRIAPKIVMFLPRNVDINQLAELSLAATPPWYLEVEKNFLNDRLKAVTAYFCEPPSMGRS